MFFRILERFRLTEGWGCSLCEEKIGQRTSAVRFLWLTWYRSLVSSQEGCWKVPGGLGSWRLIEIVSVHRASLIVILGIVLVLCPCFSLIADTCLSEAVQGSLFPTVPATIKATCSWKDNVLSSTVDVRVGGTIAKGRTLTLGGKLNIGVSEGVSLQSGWVKYGEPDWSVSVGNIAFPGTVSTDTMSIELDYTPQGSLYSAKYHRDANRSSLDLDWKWSTLSFGIRLSNGDFSLSSSINTDAVKMEVKIEQSGFTLAFTPHSSGGFSLSAKLVSNSGETTFSFSSVWGPFSGKLGFGVSESTRKTEIAPQFTTSLAGGWKLKANLEFKRALGENIHTFDSKGSLCLSYNGSPLSGSLTTTFTDSSNLLTGIESNRLTVQEKSTFQFDSGWAIALDTTVSQQLGTTDQPTSSVKIGFSVPLHSDSWHAGFKLDLQTGQEGKASFSVSAGDMSIDVSASRSSFSLSLGMQFDTLLPFIKTKEGW